MTSTQILIKFNQRILSMYGIDAEIFRTYEIEEFLNSSLYELYDYYCDNFEKNESARRSLAKLVSTNDNMAVNGSATGKIDTNSTVYIIPSDCYRIVTAKIDIRYNESLDGTDDTITVKPITHDQYTINIKNYYKKPSRSVAWRMDYEDGSEVITDGTYSILKYFIRYVVNPTLVNVNGDDEIDMLEKDLNKIVDMAIVKAIQSLSNNRVIKQNIVGQNPANNN